MYKYNVGLKGYLHESRDNEFVANSARYRENHRQVLGMKKDKQDTLVNVSFIQGIERFRRSALIESNSGLVSSKLSGSFYFVDAILTRES